MLFFSLYTIRWLGMLAIIFHNGAHQIR
jgi:hypothetical protein